MAEAREPAADDGTVARRQQGREWRALGATLLAPGVLCTASMLDGGALSPFSAATSLGAAISVTTGLLGVLSLAFGAFLLLTGRARRSAAALVLAWAALLGAEQDLAGAVLCPSYLWLPQALWLAFLGVRAVQLRRGRPNPGATRRDTGWQLLGLALVVPGLWLGRSIVFMRLMGEPWASGTADAAYWLVQAVALPSLVAGTWTLVTARGRRAASAVSVGWLLVGVILVALVPEEGEPVTLVVPAAWLTLVLIAEAGTRAAAAWRRRYPVRVADPRPDGLDTTGAPAWRTAATGVLVFVGWFALTAVVVAGVVR